MGICEVSRARNIKPSFFKNEVLAQCSAHARLVFIGLWGLADREGRLEDRPLRIKAEILPYEDCDIDKLLTELVRGKFILRYGEHSKYIQVLAFKKHQSPHVKEGDSTIPAPDKPYAIRDNHEASPSDSLFPLPDSPSPIAAKAAKVNGSRRPKDEIWESLLTACGIPLTATISPSARGAYNRAVKDLKSMGASPEMIAARGKAFSRKWPSVSLTPTALVRRWNESVVPSKRP